MYLKELMQGEKFAFYSIVKNLVSIDGEFTTDEQALVDGFLAEMSLERNQINDIPVDDAIKMFSYSTASVRKKVFLELVGVTLCDDMLHQKEKEFLDKIAESFLISEDDKNAIIRTVKDLLDIYKKMAVLVNK